MSIFPPTWNDEKIAQLRALHAENLPFSQIAAILKVGRSAAIGKAHRLGLRCRITLKCKSAQQKPQPTHPKRAKRRGNLFDIVPPLAPDTHELIHEHVANPLTLLELQADSCRWPVVGEGLATLFCGDTAAAGCSYCARHYRMSIASGGRTISRAAAEMGRREAARNYRKRKAA
jgi:hypothetical protein